MENIRKYRFTDSFFSACRQFYEEPIYRHADEKGVRILIWADDITVLYEYLVAAVSCGQGVGSLAIDVCGRDALELEKRLTCPPEGDPEARPACPLYGELAKRGAADIRYLPEPDAAKPDYAICEGKFISRLPADVYAVEAGAQGSMDELIRLAENLNYAYAVSYRDRRSFSEITDELYTFRKPGTDPEKAAKMEINYASSVLQAAHIPVKMHIVGADDPDTETAVEYYQKAVSDTAIRSRVVYLEHLRWSTFMILRGFRTPTREEMEAVYTGGKERINSFRNDEEGVHPALAVCSQSAIDALDGVSEAFWNDYDPNMPDQRYSDLDELSLMSLFQHWHARKHIQTDRAAAEALLRTCGSNSSGILQLQKAIAGFDQSGSAGLENAVRTARERGVEESLLKDISALMESSLEASRRRSYLQGDIYSVEAQGYVLLKRRAYKNVIRTLSPDYAANVVSLARIDPEKVAFIVPADMPYRERESLEKSVRTFIKQRRLCTEIKLYELPARTVRSARAVIYDIRSWTGGPEAGTVFDLTGAVPELVMAAADDPCGCFICNDQYLVPFRGCRSVTAMNALPLSFSVEDVFAAIGRTSIEGWDVPDMNGIGEVAEKMLEAYIAVTQPAKKKNRDGDVFIALREYIFPTAKDNPNPCRKEYSPKGRTRIDRKKDVRESDRRNLTGCLYRLANDGFIDDLQITLEHSEDDERNVYHVTCITEYSELIEQLFSDSAQDNPTYSAKYSKSKRPMLRWMGDTFDMPEKAALKDAVKAFAKAGCFTVEKSKTGGPDRVKFSTSGLKAIFGFGSEGLILEDALYFAFKSNPNYSEVRLGYSFGVGELSENEIDVVAITRRGRPVYVSCKSGSAVSIGAGHEIYRHTKLYNLNHPIAVLAATEPRPEDKELDAGGRMRRYFEEDLGIEYLDRSLLGDWDALQEKLTQIATSN